MKNLLILIFSTALLGHTNTVSAQEDDIIERIPRGNDDIG